LKERRAFDEPRTNSPMRRSMSCSQMTALEPVDCLRANKRTQLTALRFALRQSTGSNAELKERRAFDDPSTSSPMRRSMSCNKKVDVRLPEKGNSNSHGARPVHLIITMITWIRTSGTNCAFSVG